MTVASADAGRRWSSSNPTSKERFPEFDQSESGDIPTNRDDNGGGTTSSRSPSPAKMNGGLRNDRWHVRKDNHLVWGNGHINVSGPRQHVRQKSLSDAFKNIRNRRASVSENAHEIAEALKAPISYKIIVSGFYGGIQMCLTEGILDPMPRLVLELGIDEHILQIYSKCLP